MYLSRRRVAIEVKIFMFFFLMWCRVITSAQNILIKGTVKDAYSKESLPFVNVFFEGSTKGTTTDIDGNFLIKADTSTKKIKFSYLGYKPVTKNIRNNQKILDIRLEPEVQNLNEIVVKREKKEKYRNKNNYAVELIRKVIENKQKNRMANHNYVQYEQYEKLQFSLSSSIEKYKNKKALSKYKFLFDNQDTTKLKDKSLLPFYLHEKITQNYIRKNPKDHKTIVLADKSVNFGEYIDNQGLDTYLSRLYQDFDIYENNIFIMTNEFLSPIADVSPNFYKFFITDTLTVDNLSFTGISFIPRNKTDFLFQGKLYVSMDTMYAVQRINMTVNKDINLNWVRELYIDQDFQKGVDNRHYLKKSRIMGDFAITKNNGGIFGERTISFSQFKIDTPQPDSVYKGEEVVFLSNANKMDEKFWSEARHDSLNLAESNTYKNIDSLQKMPSFRRTMDLISLVLFGYKKVGQFEIGPVNSFYSINPVEGFRLRFGGRTTPQFNKNLYLETYVAYGFKDEKWKYFLSGTYSFTNKSLFQFPVHYLKASYQHDTKIPGQELQFVQEDNFLLSFKRGKNNKWLYNNIYVLEYLKEFKNHFSFKLGFKNWLQQPAGALNFIEDSGDNVSGLNTVTTSEAMVELRLAPQEQFYQTKLYRVPIPGPNPVFTLRFIQGMKGVFNGQYNYQNLTANINKRFYFSQLGYTDVILEGGYIFGKLPYPLLIIHRANQTYAYQLNSYNLMNFLEFVSDRYLSINIDHYFNGFIFNKLPLIKKLKFREVVTLKLLYGGIRAENNPDNDRTLYKLPTQDGLPITYSLTGEPYVEMSAGVANIFKFLRIDFVKRLTYLDHPFISDWGIRGRVVFEF